MNLEDEYFIFNTDSLFIHLSIKNLPPGKCSWSVVDFSQCSRTRYSDKMPLVSLSSCVIPCGTIQTYTCELWCFLANSSWADPSLQITCKINGPFLRTVMRRGHRVTELESEVGMKVYVAFDKMAK